MPGILDRRDHRHVELPGGQRIGQSARIIEDKLQSGSKLRQCHDERLRIEIRHRPDANLALLRLRR